MKVGKREILYVFLMVSAAGLGFIRTIVYGAYLSPKLMGYYSIAITIAGYGPLLHLGLMSGLNRELPFCLGGRKLKYSSDLVGETSIGVVSFQLIGILLYFLIISNITFVDLSKRNAFILGGLLAFSASFSQIVILRLRAEQRILSFSFLQVISFSVILFLGVISIKYFSYMGPILSRIIVNFLSFIIVSLTILSSVNYLHFRFKELLYLMRIGFPMMVAGMLFVLQTSMDRLFLIKNVSVTEIGVYQIGILPLIFGITINGIVNQYLSPKLLFRYGQGYSLKHVFNRSLKVSFIMVCIMSLFYPLVYPLSNFVINRWLPNYNESLSLILIFYIGTIFISANITGIVINAANRQVLALYEAVFIVVMCFIGYLLITHYGMTIKWYAYLNVAAQIMNFFLTIGISYYLVKNPHRIVKFSDLGN